MSHSTEEQDGTLPSETLSAPDMPAAALPNGARPSTCPPQVTDFFRRFVSKLYNWVVLMIIVGAVVGHFWPRVGVAMQPVAEGFIALIKMLIPPVIFCTVVLGIAGAGGIRKAGRVGAKALIYFEVVSTFALILGLAMAHWFGPGRSFHAQPLHILVVAMLTSKGATGVTGSGFITLAATLAAVPAVPVAGMALILGIDKFMSEARAITNHIGNCTAAVLMAIWEKEIDWKRFRSELAAGSRTTI